MKRLPYTVQILIPGLLAVHIIAAIQVYVSNRDLYRTLADLAAAGYLIVPNELVMPSLLEPSVALAGALFFTFSLGAGLTVLSLFAAWVWDRIFLRKNAFLISCVFLWGMLVTLPNVRKFSPFVSLYFFLIPPLVFYVTAKSLPPLTGGRRALGEAAHVIPFVIIAALWGTSMNEWFFLNFRDTFLLSNPAGIRVNDFYYRYTLYPAEAFKTLQQKTLKTCRITGVADVARVASLADTLARFDYCVVDSPAHADLTLREQDGALLFERDGAVLVKGTTKDFLARPGEALREFSQQSDGNLFFRRITFLALAAGLPAALYIMIWGLTRFLLSFLMSTKRTSIAASIVCLAAGMALGVSFYVKSDAVPPDRVAAALESHDWRVRVAALRTIDHTGMEIGDFPSYRNMIAGPHVAERYWIAFMLGKSRFPGTYPDIVVLLNDPHPNVVCKAIEALGKRGDTGTIEVVKERLRTSDNWYVQWYAYRAMRSLGWKQRKSM